MSGTLIAIGGVILAVLAALWKAFAAGQTSQQNKERKQDEETRKEFDKIDSAAPDFDASVNRLRDRSTNRKPGSK